MLKSTSSPLLLFQRKFMLYHQSFSHFLLFIITLCHRKIFTLRIMLYYRFLCNFVHCKQFFLFNFFFYPRNKKKEKLFVCSCVIWCVCVPMFECIEMNSLRFFVWKFMLSEVSIIDELKLNCGKRKFVIVNTYVIFVVIYSFMYGLTKFYSKVNGIFLRWTSFVLKDFTFISIKL